MIKSTRRLINMHIPLIRQFLTHEKLINDLGMTKVLRY